MSNTSETMTPEMTMSAMPGAISAKIAALDATKPQDLLLKSFNVLKITQPDLLLADLHKCKAMEIPDDNVSLNDRTERFTGKYTEQASARETKQSLSVSVGIEGKYGVYSGSLQVDYSQSEITNSTSFFSSFVAKLNMGSLAYNGSAELTLSLLDPKMKSDLLGINTLSDARAFTERWGTHLVTRVNLGGMLFVSIQANTNSKEEKTKLATSLKMKYSSVGSLSAAADVVTEMAKTETSNQLTQNVVAVGGLGKAAAKIVPSDKKTFENWIDSCSIDTVFSVSESVEIFTLASGTARNMLKKYLDLTMLAFSLEHPTIFMEQKSITPYNTNTITAPNKHTEGYKIIGGGASAFTSGSNSSSSYLLGSYPQANGTDAPTGWNAVSHDVALAADSSRDVLSAYAIAVYDPENYLEVKTATGTGANPGKFGDTASAKIGTDLLLTSGGIDCGTDSGASKYVLASYFSDTDNYTWLVASSDYKIAATQRTLTAYAMGLKSKDAGLTITSVRVKGPQATGQHGAATANAQTCICGGGVRVWDNKGMGNLVQSLYPATPTTWATTNHDLDGSISVATYQAFAIALRAKVG